MGLAQFGIFYSEEIDLQDLRSSTKIEYIGLINLNIWVHTIEYKCTCLTNKIFSLK